MTELKLKVEDDLVALLHATNKTASEAALEYIVLELYRRGAITSGKAGEWLGLSKHEFLIRASSMGIATLDMTDDEWQAERDRSATL